MAAVGEKMPGKAANLKQKSWLALIAAGWLILAVATGCYPPLLVVPTPTPEPLIPTVPPHMRGTATVTVRPEATLALSASASATPAPAASPWQVGGSPRSRVCVSVPGADASPGNFDWGDALPGWWLNWNVLAAPPPGPPFAQMVRLQGAQFAPDIATIQRVARSALGALWLIGNEPDVAWQDNATPEQYAASYARIYRALKQVDATAQVAIGGVSQPTPLRMAYLDRILAAYRQQTGTEMPVDVWNVHAFILREELDSWGVGIPPGMSEERGLLRDIAEHTDMTLFAEQIVDFRQWMADRGYQDRPLIVSEYGVLMPPDYGFPPETVAAFMRSTFDYFLSTTNDTTGLAADGNRLVQGFCWFSAADEIYPTSNLFDPTTRTRTAVGEAFRTYMMELAD